MNRLDALLSRVGVQSADLAGASLNGEIPIPSAVINRFIAEQLARRSLPLTSVRIEPLDDDAFAAELEPRMRMMPAVTVVARIERQPDLPRDALLELRWSIPKMGALAMFAAPALSFFKALPPGIRVDGDRLTVDLRQLLVEKGFGDVLPYMTALRVGTRRGMLVVRFAVKV